MSVKNNLIVSEVSTNFTYKKNRGKSLVTISNNCTEVENHFDSTRRVQVLADVLHLIPLIRNFLDNVDQVVDLLDNQSGDCRMACKLYNYNLNVKKIKLRRSDQLFN